MNYVAYYRVSTLRQGKSGLGLEAQEAIVNNFIKEEDEIMLSFTEVESRRKNDRPQLLRAIQACKELKATLLVANMTRLTGNAAFFFTLRDSGLPLKFADLPEADEFVIGIMALLAERETKVIRKRIVDALAAKKARGDKLGTPINFSNTGREAGNLAMKKRFQDKVDKIRSVTSYLIKEGKTDGEIIKTIPTFYPGEKFKYNFLWKAVKLIRATKETISS